MRSITGIFGHSLAALAVVSCAMPQAKIEADYVFENVNIVPLNEEIVLPDRVIAVRNEIIVAILDQASAGDIVAPTRVDAAGNYLVPGLTDMHIHMRMDPQAAFSLFLANGVTSVFNMGLSDRNGDVEIDHLSLRDDVIAGRIDGPRYSVSGPQLHAEELPTVAAVEPTLDHHVEQGYDTIKVHGPLDTDVYDHLVRSAQARGLRITGHAQHLRPLSDSLHVNAIEHAEEFLYVSRDPAHGEAAAGSMDNYLRAYFPHSERMSDPEYRKPVVRELAESGVYVDPTLIIYKYILFYISDDLFAELQLDDHLAYLPKSTRDVYMDPESNGYRTGFAKILGEYLGGQEGVVAHTARNVETLSALVYEMHEAGVPLLLGTDAFGAVVPGFSVHQELKLMVDAGLTPFEALRTGTVNAAAYLGETETAGTVEIGKRADFFLVSENPLDDIGNAAHVEGVFSNGKWRAASNLANMLEAVIAQSEGEE
jgi:imidazolonepropionase-like amidohydrolase